MTVNRKRPHVFVIPEDDANRQLANAFVLEVDHDRQIMVLKEAGGWLSVCEAFRSEHIKGLRQYPDRYIVLLLDFDDHVETRAEKIIEQVPEEFKARVFLLGVKSEPEELKRAGLGSFEDIGRTLGRECRDGSRSVWSHELLRHNENELDRLERAVRGILFSSSS
jgi:hypothetical protein